jgi:hypothetical protein
MRKLHLEIKTQKVRKIILKNNLLPDSGLKLKFETEKRFSGWIDFYISTNNRSLKIGISNVFSPFRGLVYFLFGITTDRLPNFWEIDEEGICKQFFVYAVDNHNLRLIILNDCFIHKNFTNKDLDKVVIDTIIPKKDLLKEFFTAFENFIKNDFEEKRWRISSSKCKEDDLTVYFKILQQIFINKYHIDRLDTIHFYS